MPRGSLWRPNSQRAAGCLDVERGDGRDIDLADSRCEKSAQHVGAEFVETGMRFAIRGAGPLKDISEGRILSELLGGERIEIGYVISDPSETREMQLGLR